MTTERIDHAAEARSILHEIANAGPEDNLPQDWCGASEDEKWLVTGGLREAQVHATLALVEQQRIANLIALTHHQRPELVWREAAKMLYRGDTNDGEALGLNPDIAAALGVAS